MEQGLTVNKLPTDYREKLENAKIKEKNTWLREHKKRKKKVTSDNSVNK